jgi:hypothetical protein
MICLFWNPGQREVRAEPWRFYGRKYGLDEGEHVMSPQPPAHWTLNRVKVIFSVYARN